MTITAIRPGDVIAWGTPGAYERRGVVRAVSMNNETLFVQQTQPPDKNRFIRIPSHRVRKVRLSSTS